jgi:hypothetical protein
VGIDSRGDPYERERKISSSYVPSRGEQDRRRSPYAGTGTPYPVSAGGVYADTSGYPPSSAYSAGNTGAYSPNRRPGELGGGSSAYPPAGHPSEPFPRAPSPYARAPSPYARSTTPYARAPSPYAGGGGSGGAVYPRGHILEGQPMNRSRAPSPIPGAIGLPGGGTPAFPQPGIPIAGGVSPNIGGMAPLSGPGGFPQSGQPQEQLAAPEGFSRPINAAQPYTPFDTMKIQDMDAFLENIPKMPLVLQPHDVYHSDWIRFMQVR